MNIDFKALDTQKIKSYINASGTVITVEEIIQNSGADKLRVYPTLFELEQDGWLEVVEREELGAPLVVRWRKDTPILSGTLADGCGTKQTNDR